MRPVSRRHLLLTAAGTATLVATGAVLPAAASATGHDPDDPTVVVEWNRTLLRVVRTPHAQPATVHPTRSFAMLHGAIHDAVENVRHRGSAVAAAAQAGHDILAALYPSMAATFDQQLADELATVANPYARDAGVRAGQRAACCHCARTTAPTPHHPRSRPVPNPASTGPHRRTSARRCSPTGPV